LRKLIGALQEAPKNEQYTSVIADGYFREQDLLVLITIKLKLEDVFIFQPKVSFL